MFIDEADSLEDDLFLALLRQLRAGFEARPSGFPHSIALVGLRDVRDYKIRIRPEGESLGTGSPFNIKTKSIFMDAVTMSETDALLHQHAKETGLIERKERIPGSGDFVKRILKAAEEKQGHHFFPYEQRDKLMGFQPEIIDAGKTSGVFRWIIVETDGAARKPLKAPADHKPVISL